MESEHISVFTYRICSCNCHSSWNTFLYFDRREVAAFFPSMRMYNLYIHDALEKREVFHWSVSLCSDPWPLPQTCTKPRIKTHATEFKMGRWLGSKKSACTAENTGDSGSIPESGRPPGGGNGNPLQFSCLENSMDRGAWRATVHGVAKSQTRLKRLNTLTEFNYIKFYLKELVFGSLH